MLKPHAVFAGLAVLVAFPMLPRVAAARSMEAVFQEPVPGSVATPSGRQTSVAADLTLANDLVISDSPWTPVADAPWAPATAPDMAALELKTAGTVKTDHQAIADLPLAPVAETTPPLLGQIPATTASQNGWYVSIAPSLVFGYDLDIEADDPVTIVVPAPIPGFPAIPTDVDVDVSIDTSTGFGVAGAVGYRFGDGRVELEADYNRNDADSIQVNDFDSVPVDGSVEALQFFLNGYYDIPTNSRFRPYIGGGVGISFVSANDIEATVPVLGAVSIDDSSASFVFQAKAGVSYDISDTAIVFAGYRLYGVPGQTFEALDTDFSAETLFVHSLQLGFRYEF
jgi:opacity protein-like surface antigen